MIKDVMVRLEGTVADDIRLAAAVDISRRFEGHLIGLFLNILPPPAPADPDGAGLLQTNLLYEEARAAGDATLQLLTARLNDLDVPVEIRRFDILSGEIPGVCAREARSADTFVALRPNSSPEEPDRIVENVLFGSGRHLYLIPPGGERKTSFDSVLIAWNGSREAARALAESLPYIKHARTVVVCVVDTEPPVGEEAQLGTDAKQHLRHHGIAAVLHHIDGRKSDVEQALLAEAGRRRAELIVMGGYGHSRLREWLLGGVTYELMHQSPIPLLLAH
jgi:nucleotide-binding universal stress UspA family protein